MKAVDKVLAVARAEIGYLEKKSNSQLDDKTANAGYANWNKYARDLDQTDGYNGKKNGYEWCDIFVDWCFTQAFGHKLAWEMLGQPSHSAGAGCEFSAMYFKSKGRFYKTPQPGDQIFFQSGGTACHTGIVESVTASTVTTIEGNTSGASGVVANGGGVCRKTYAIGSGYIMGYGRPDWSKAADDDTPDFRKMLQERAGLADGTMDYLAAYRWGNDLIRKLATME